MPNIIFRDMVVRSELSSLITSSYKYINKQLISAFVDRYQPDTNTFHMPFGELTITLDDVGTILGIPLTGRSISAYLLSHE